VARSHVVLLTLALSAVQSQSQTPKPLWEVDLSRFGYQGRPPAALLHLSPDSQNDFDWANQQGVVFTGPDVVAAYFVVYDAPSGVSEPREPKITDSFRLVTVFLNAKNGEPIKQLDWTLPPDSVQVSQSFFYPASQGRFIVILGETVNLYSSDFKLLARFEAHGEMGPFASPSGESLLVRTFSRPTIHYDLLETEKLSVLKSWDQPAGSFPRQIDSLWGDRLAWTKPFTLYFGTAASEPKKLLAAARPESCDTLKPVGNPARPRPWCDIQDNLPTVAGNFCGGWQLIGKDSLVGPVCSGDDKLLTVSTERKILHEFNLGLEQADGPVVASANGQRFAIPTTRLNRQTARVFDLGSGNPLLTVDVPADKDSSREFSFANYGDIRFGWGGVALSPGGSRLAVKLGGSVRIYSVPEQAAAGQCTSNCDGAATRSNPPPPHPSLVPKPSSPLVKRMLSWFPADTETLMGATGPLQMPKMSRDANGDPALDSSSPDAVRDTFRQFFLLLLVARLEKEFKDAPITAAIEGSRTFRPPNGLGMATYQGGLIAVFKDDITARAAAFIKDSASAAVRSVQIEGQPVEVFQDKSEGNILTTYVAFPKPDVAVVATDESYLREVLARIGGKQGERALPDTLPEWEHLDTNAAFWALRHYSKTEIGQCALLPPNCRAGHSTDEKPIGLTFSFSPGASNLATVDYLSGDEDYLRCIQKELIRQNERGVAEMQMQYSESQSGVLEGSYNLSEIESAQYFLFVLVALVGHPIFI
jgi:hypothetical protein